MGIKRFPESDCVSFPAGGADLENGSAERKKGWGRGGVANGRKISHTRKKVGKTQNEADKGAEALLRGKGKLKTNRAADRERRKLLTR